MGKQWKQWLTLFFWAPKSLKMVIAAIKLKDICSLEGKETVETVADFTFLDSKITTDGDCSHGIKRYLLLGKKPRQHIKKQRHYFANKGPSSQGYGFSSGHVWM